MVRFGLLSDNVRYKQTTKRHEQNLNGEKGRIAAKQFRATFGHFGGLLAEKSYQKTITEGVLKAKRTDPTSDLVVSILFSKKIHSSCIHSYHSNPNNYSL